MIRFKYVLALALPLLTGCASGQILKPQTWTWEASKTSVKAGDEVDLIFHISIDEGWYVYSNDFDVDCGPIPASVTFENRSGFELVGGLKAIGDKKKFDPTFECDVRIFEHQGEFRQKIKITGEPLVIQGTYEGQVCSDRCIPFDGDFSFASISLIGSSSGFQKPIVVAVPDAKTDSASTARKASGPQLTEDISIQIPQNKSIWLFLALSFVAGFFALITPCVFPMIPMTVTFFTGKEKNKSHAFFYGFFVILIYTIVGALVAPLMGPETANQLSTEWLPNIIFFIVFIVFGLSFLGLFEITLPGTLITKVDKQADKGGLGGVFFMAFTLVLVSFSCTGPIVGSILVSSAGGEYLRPILGMFAFALAFSIPFTLFAIFPRWLNSLPKSGGWLNTVKVVLGFLEIALAFKFLSIADQAFHWGILDRDVNIAIWIVIFSLMGIYLMKGFVLPGDTSPGKVPDKTIGVPRLSLAIVTFSFVVYLIPGMWGAPLKALAGYLPPLYTHDFDLISALQPKEENKICDEPKYTEFLHLPHGLSGYFDYNQAISCAQQQGKPLFIDFTGHGCTNCREMEAVVWSDKEVLKRLREDFVVVALYVDDKTELPESEWFTSEYDGKIKKTIGKQNADLQISKLNNNAQPFYVLVGKDEKVLVPPYGYDRSVEHFTRFLDSGKSAYNAQ